MPASKYSPELRDEICEQVRDGVQPSSAARKCGLGRSTHYDWMRHGDNGVEPYSDYSDAIKRAQSEAEAMHIGNIKQAAKDGKWQASAWWLERTIPGTYGRPNISLGAALKVIGDALGSEEESLSEHAARALRKLVSRIAQKGKGPGDEALQ